MITIKKENFRKSVFQALRRRVKTGGNVVVRYEFFEDGKSGFLKIEVHNDETTEIIETPIELSHAITDRGKKVKGICFLIDRRDVSLEFVTRNHWLEAYRYGYDGDIKFVDRDCLYHLSTLLLYNEKRNKRMTITNICFDACELVKY